MKRKKMRNKRPGGQTHPTGERWSIDEKYKVAVRAELRARGWSQARLARELGVVPASITHLFKSSTKQTRLVKRIAKLFNWVDTTGPIVATGVDDTFRLVAEDWLKLTVDERTAVANIVAAMAASRQSKP